MMPNEIQTIALCATARWVDVELIQNTELWLQKLGYKTKRAENLSVKHHQFSGTDDERSVAFQALLDDKTIDAIWCLRGGYGTVRIVDSIDWASFKKHPKYIIGFSDFTILLNHVLQFNIPSIHAPMPIQHIDLDDDSKLRLEQSFSLICPEMVWKSNQIQQSKSIKGKLAGGNLSVLFSMLGSDSFPKLQDSILFLEDLDEYVYHIDRMMFALWRAGALGGIKGFLIGGFTSIHDHKLPFGQSVEGIFSFFAEKLDVPIFFDAPVGHQKQHFPLVFGRETLIKQHKDHISLLHL
ncbi:MAG: S66 peptidase family protein [Flavobacteriales bacterium]